MELTPVPGYRMTEDPPVSLIRELNEMRLRDEQEQAAGLYAASTIDRSDDHHLPEFSPAIGEHAVLATVPQLRQELADAYATIHELRGRIAAMDPGGAVAEAGW